MSAPSLLRRFSPLAALRPGAGARLMLAAALVTMLWLAVWWAS